MAKGLFLNENLDFLRTKFSYLHIPPPPKKRAGFARSFQNAKLVKILVTNKMPRSMRPDTRIMECVPPQT
jgi:hypothetical protein